VMVVLTLTGTAGTFVNPFLGVAVYYTFAVLRPQAIWEWSLPRGISWSFYVALATLGAAALQLMGPGESVPGRPAPRFTPAHAAGFVSGAWLAVTYVTARDQEAALPTLIEYGKIFLMSAASTLLIRTARHVWILFALAGLSLGYIAYEINFIYLATGYLGI